MDLDTLLAPDGWATGFIRERARRLACRTGINSCDVDDLAQEALAAVVQKWSAFDESRGKWTTYLARIVDSTLASYVRQRHRVRRDARRCHNFSQIDHIASSRDGDTYSASDLRLDVRAAVKQLDPALQRICRELDRGSISDAARRLGIHRSTLYSQLTRVRQQFEDAGLKDYVPDILSTNGVCKRKNRDPITDQERCA